MNSGAVSRCRSSQMLHKNAAVHKVYESSAIDYTCADYIFRKCKFQDELEDNFGAIRYVFFSLFHHWSLAPLKKCRARKCLWRGLGLKLIISRVGRTVLDIFFLLDWRSSSASCGSVDENGHLPQFCMPRMIQNDMIWFSSIGQFWLLSPRPAIFPAQQFHLIWFNLMWLSSKNNWTISHFLNVWSEPWRLCIVWFSWPGVIHLRMDTQQLNTFIVKQRMTYIEFYFFWDGGCDWVPIQLLRSLDKWTLTSSPTRWLKGPVWPHVQKKKKKSRCHTFSLHGLRKRSEVTWGWVSYITGSQFLK
jgi:hypothetical protein